MRKNCNEELGEVLARLFDAAKIRAGICGLTGSDAFAVDLLEKGVPLGGSFKALGHESIKTTERSYAKWVKGRQDRLNALVTATWKK